MTAGIEKKCMMCFTFILLEATDIHIVHANVVFTKGAFVLSQLLQEIAYRCKNHFPSFKY